MCGPMTKKQNQTKMVKKIYEVFIVRFYMRLYPETTNRLRVQVNQDREKNRRAKITCVFTQHELSNQSDNSNKSTCKSHATKYIIWKILYRSFLYLTILRSSVTFFDKYSSN